MRSYIEEICAWNAGHIITDLCMEIGMDEKYYLDTLSTYLDPNNPPSPKTILTWRRRNRGLPAKYTYERLVKSLDAVMKHYREDSNIPSPQKAPVLARWEERREVVSKWLKSTLELNIGPSPAERLQEQMADRYPKWTLETVFTLYNSFDALNSTTWNDLRFWRALLNTPKEARADKVAPLTRREVSARLVLDCLYNSEVAQWQGLLGEHNTERTKEDLWERLLEKVEGCDCNLIIWGQLLDLLIDRGTGSIIGEPRLEYREMALFILFKYCLTEEAQDEVLESWA